MTCIKTPLGVIVRMLSQAIYDDGDDDDNEMWVSLMLEDQVVSLMLVQQARGWVSCHQEASGSVTFIVNIIN